MNQPVLAYYGDDFTGSTDVMEVMQWSGLRTVLFLEPPTPKQLQQFEGLKAFGVAGRSRSMSPTEMESELKPDLNRLKESGAAIVHYKICSTFDSSPDIGSIGKAIEVGRDVFGCQCVPIVVGAPNLGRYQVFGNLFARSGLDTDPYRLDRHPTMKHHPITPMEEADLRLHLAEQTDLEIGLWDLVRLRQAGEVALSPDTMPGEAVLFDVLQDDDLPQIGKVLQSIVDHAPPAYIVGSSGVEYALTAYWTQNGRIRTLRSHEPGRPLLGATEQLVAVTGSCSPVNDRQIAWAEQHGFETIPLDAARLVNPATCEQEIQSTAQRALESVGRGASVILHSSRGPKDPRVAQTAAALRSMGLSEHEIRLHSGRILGPKLGRILETILKRRRLDRVGVAGGDTSGYVARELGITALEAVAPVAPGSPLCRAYTDNELDGVEFFFKGGQVGRDDVWGTMRDGKRDHNELFKSE